MQSSAWVAFLQHVPESLLNGLCIKTVSGTEVTVQSILRIDHEFVAIKGRIAASQDTGRIFFIPFNQIEYVGYMKDLAEAEFQQVFDSLQVPAPVAGVAAATVVEIKQAGPPVATPPPVPAPVAAARKAESAEVPVNRATPLPLKSAVLERFRSRSSSIPGVPNRPSSQG
jgi:hypothetical protein